MAKPVEAGLVSRCRARLGRFDRGSRTRKGRHVGERLPCSHRGPPGCKEVGSTVPWSQSHQPALPEGHATDTCDGFRGCARLATRPYHWKSRLALAQARQGQHRSIDTLRTFRSVPDQHKAALGCCVTVGRFDTGGAPRILALPSRIHGGGYPYRQFNPWSISENSEDRLPLVPPMTNPFTGRPMARVVLF